MVMRKSSDEHLAAIKEHFETKKRIKYEEFIQKHFYRQVVSNEKKSEYYKRIKIKAQELSRRHREAAARRKVIFEEKQNKILARKQSRSESRGSKSSSFSEIISSSKPGVFVTRLVSTSDMQGTAGFGRGYVKKPRTPAAAVEHPRSPWSSSAVSTPDERLGSLLRSSESNQSVKSDRDRVSSPDRTACSDISDTNSFYNPAPFIIQDMDLKRSPEVKYIIPEKQLKKFLDESRKYRALRSLKKVSFDSSKHVERISKPVIKKSLQIDTPETKKGILLKMTEVNSKRKLELNSKCEPEVPSLSILTDTVQKEIDLAGKGDSLVLCKESVATERDPIMGWMKRTSSPMKAVLDDSLNCGTLLQTREYEKNDRKLKLLQLQEDLKNIEMETKRLSSKNADVSRILRAKESEFNN